MIQFITDTLGWRFLLSFVLAVTLWARLTLEQNPERREIYPTEIPVEVTGLPSNLVVANDIQPVKLRIGAPQESWRRLQASSFRAVVDLSRASPGLEQPDVNVEVSDPDVRILDKIPSKVSVRIEELRTVSVPVHVTQLGSVPFGYRVNGEPIIDPPTVQVSGPASAVQKVSEAVVSVRMDEVKSTLDQSLKPEPRGASGVVSGVRLEPQSVTVTFKVEQIAGSKAIPVVPQIRGQVAPGYWISAITVEPASVQVVGDPNLLESVTVLNTADVDVTGAIADVVRSVPISRPSGITVVRDQNATVRVAVLPLPGQQARDVTVTVANVASGLSATINPATINVSISGTQPALARIGAADVAASVDLRGIGEGTQSVLVNVAAPDGVRVDRVTPDRVTVTLTQNAAPTTVP